VTLQRASDAFGVCIKTRIAKGDRGHFPTGLQGVAIDMPLSTPKSGCPPPKKTTVQKLVSDLCKKKKKRKKEKGAQGRRYFRPERRGSA
jgi:hypothetical protein